MSRSPLTELGNNLGDYLREQRQSARMSLRQLADLAGVSNPYLSQIERGLKKPSADILSQLARALEVSAESLYVHAGFLDEDPTAGREPMDVRTAIAADRRLTDRQKATLLDVYESFVDAEPGPAAAARTRPAPARKKSTTRASAPSAPRTEKE